MALALQRWAKKAAKKGNSLTFFWKSSRVLRSKLCRRAPTGAWYRGVPVQAAWSPPSPPITLGPRDIQHCDPKMGQAIAGGSGMGSEHSVAGKAGLEQEWVVAWVLLGLPSSCRWGRAATWNLRDMIPEAIPGPSVVHSTSWAPETPIGNEGPCQPVVPLLGGG